MIGLFLGEATTIGDMGTSASTLIGDLVIGFGIVFAIMWVIVKSFELLYALWHWVKKTEDRLISNWAGKLAEKEIRREKWLAEQKSDEE